MGTHIFRTIRAIQLVISLPLAALTVATLLRGRLGVGIGLAVLTAFVAATFEWRAAGVRRSIAAVRSSLESASRCLEGASEVTERLPGTPGAHTGAVSEAVVRMVTRRGIRFFAKGMRRGRPVELGTTIMASRDLDTFASHVIVDAVGPATTFRGMSKGTMTTLARIGIDKRETTTGDAVFDDRWVVDCDHAQVTAALDAGLRGRLMEIANALPPFGVASFERLEHGMIVRTAGQLDAALATKLHDLAVDLLAGLEGGKSA